MKYFLIVLSVWLHFSAFSQRQVTSLNGQWDVEESVLPDEIPKYFNHRGPVPGMANLCIPAFKDVDAFDGIDYLNNSWVRASIKNIQTDTLQVGISRQDRNYFWYRTTFELQKKQELNILKINKAQFGTKVWINGVEVGHHFGCFTAGYFDISRYVVQPGGNTLIIRIGAHPGAVPSWVPTGSDYEKPKWTPGIYDDVSVISTGYPYIAGIQVAPNIYDSSILVQTKIIHQGKTKNVNLNYMIRPVKGINQVVQKKGNLIKLMNNDTLLVSQNIKVKDLKRWSPSDPNLYILEVDLGQDSHSTRFGMRDFRFDTRIKRAFLNGDPYYLRGSNITLHRFFDDDHCGDKPWNEEWVRKLLVEWPKQFNWNSFRFCIGPVPDFWLDIADEAGLIIQNEFFIWPYHNYWDTLEIKKQVVNWMEDNWNHPSVAWWDICNETDTEALRSIIRDVRDMDLSNRAWDNGYGLPVGINDPVEDHHYNISWDGWSFEEYDKHVAAKTTNSPHPTAHAPVLNEYGWLWLNRDGSPTLLTKRVYDAIAPGYSNQERIELAAYLLGIETEYFRAHRNYAGVMHFTFLTGNFENVITGDLFSDIETLEIHEPYKRYLKEAFKPLGVFINFTKKTLQEGAATKIAVMMINDLYKDLTGKLKLTVSSENGEKVYSEIKKFRIISLGQHTYEFNIRFPTEKGDYYLTAEAISTDSREPTKSIRKIEIVAKGNDEN